jgi:hypothetical protein
MIKLNENMNLFLVMNKIKKLDFMIYISQKVIFVI